MEDLASSSKKKDDFRARRLSIIDVSSEDDSLLGLAPRFASENQEQKSLELFEPIDDNKFEELFEPVDGKKLQRIPESDELVPQPSECSEPERVKRNEKYNLRKSLAWDSAFFTCEGVLDAEELSSMITIDRSQKRALPGIQEEVHRSTDSISTLGSDTLTVESVETSLFDDVRASIQRSRKPVKMAGEFSQVGNGLKKMDFTSQPTMRPKVAAKKPSLISIQNSGKLARIVPSRTQFSQSVATSRVSTSSILKQSKVLDKPISTSSTRMAKTTSLGSDLLKVEKETTKISAGRGAPVSKLPAGLRNVPRASKPSSLASSTASTTEATSSFDSSSSVSSVKPGKSPSSSMKRKTDSKTGNPTMSSRSNHPKTPSRITSGDRLVESVKLRVSAQFVLPKLSSSVSPASSISDWSADSVSSVSSSQLISCSSRDSLSKSSSKRISVEFDLAQSFDCDNKIGFGSATRTSGGLPGQGVLRGSAEKVALPPTSRPSGLRLPSPKIGFFDGVVKSVVGTPKRNVPSDLPKAGNAKVSSQGSGTKSKFGKVNPEKAMAFNEANPKASISEPSKVATKEVIGDSMIVESRLVTPPNTKTDPPPEINQEDSKSEEFKDKTDLTVIYGTADISRGEISSETKSNAHEDAKITPFHEEHNNVTELDSISKKLTLPREVIKETKHGQVEYKNDEPKSFSENQIDCLIKQVGAMEITETNEMVNGNSSTSHQKLSSEDDDGFPQPVVVTVSRISVDNLSCIRIPFSAKDSLYNIGGSFDVPKATSTMSEGDKNCQLTLPADEHFDREQLT